MTVRRNTACRVRNPAPKRVSRPCRHRPDLRRTRMSRANRRTDRRRRRRQPARQRPPAVLRSRRSTARPGSRSPGNRTVPALPSHRHPPLPAIPRRIPALPRRLPAHPPRRATRQPSSLLSPRPRPGLLPPGLNRLPVRPRLHRHRLRTVLLKARHRLRTVRVRHRHRLRTLLLKPRHRLRTVLVRRRPANQHRLRSRIGPPDHRLLCPILRRPRPLVGRTVWRPRRNQPPRVAEMCRNPVPRRVHRSPAVQSPGPMPAAGCLHPAAVSRQDPQASARLPHPPVVGCRRLVINQRQSSPRPNRVCRMQAIRPRPSPGGSRQRFVRPCRWMGG